MVVSRVGRILELDIRRYPITYNHSMSAEEEIRRRIAEKGPITFGEFMEVALYWPRGGYYASSRNTDSLGGGGPEQPRRIQVSEERVGASGDYFTSPLAHPAFGALVAVQLYQMWRVLDRPGVFTVLEPGAGDGLLCRDVLDCAGEISLDFRNSLRYICIDRSAGVGYERGLDGAHRIVSGTLPLRGVVGCILSNELLDAFPVRQVVMEPEGLREVYIDQVGGLLIACTGYTFDVGPVSRLMDLDFVPAEGQTLEINVDLASWAYGASRALERGFVLTIDYGRSARELYSAEERYRGTLTTFYRHVQTDSPLERIGRQDITSQVDFTSVIRLGERAGLDFLDITDQRSFLGNLGMGDMLEHLQSAVPDRMEYAANRRGMLELVTPDGLGNFKALAQGKNVGNPTLWGFEPSDEARKLVAGLKVPVLTERHLDLRRGNSL